MLKDTLLARIETDPKILVGKPNIRGLRISVDQVLRGLAAGLSSKDILEDYPDLENEDIQASLLYAAQLVSEEQVFKLIA